MKHKGNAFHLVYQNAHYTQTGGDGLPSVITYTCFSLPPLLMVFLSFTKFSLGRETRFYGRFFETEINGIVEVKAEAFKFKRLINYVDNKHHFYFLLLVV
jgi:uncharacterized BrkB/YihY/UPF0761 family membrane protein